MDINVQEIIREAWESASQNEFFQGGFLLGVLAWLGMQLKNVPKQIWTRIDRRMRFLVYLDNKTPMYEAFSMWYRTNYPKSFKRIEAQLDEKWEDGISWFKLLRFQYEDLNFIWYRGRLLRISKEKEKLNAVSELANVHLDKYTISSVFGKGVINRLLEDVEKFWNEYQRDNKGIAVIVKDNWSDNATIYLQTYKTLDNIFVKDKDKLIRDVTDFLNKRDEYKRKGRKFKRGYLLYGPPGTGKTSLVWGIAHMLNRNVYYVNPKSFSGDNDFSKYFIQVKEGSIILIEDVDIFFTDRNNTDNKKVNISFSALLNALDGLYSPENVLIFMTTNKMESFDEAFIRKGRLDYKMLVDHPETKEVNDFMSNFFGIKDVNIEAVMGRPYGGKIPMVDVQDICDTSETMFKAVNQLYHQCRTQKHNR